jgi:hypothetical protein
MALAVTLSRPIPGLGLWTYDNLDTADSAPEAIQAGGYLTVIGSIQAVGTFGGGTVKLQGSNDGTNWADLNDTSGTAIGLTADGAAEFSTAMQYIRPLVTGGTGDDIDVFIALRG